MYDEYEDSKIVKQSKKPVQRKETSKIPRRFFKSFFVVVVVIFCVVSWNSLIDTNYKGQYKIKQAAWTGNLTAIYDTGVFPKLFGDIDTWNKGETFFFTEDKDTSDDIDEDNSMEVRFNDGSLCFLSGTLRINLPTNEKDAINLVSELGYTSFEDVQEKLIKPTVRSVLRSTANLMSAKESYNERRADFIQYAKDQIQNGLYVTDDEIREVKDLVSGETVQKSFKIISKNEDGTFKHYTNPLEGTGITVANFEIKKFRYEPKVVEQITKQQEAVMAVQTAKANAEKAEQQKLTIEAEGKARVAEAEYRELEKKVVSIVQAERDKEMAIIEAEKKKEQESIAKEQALIKASKEVEVAKLDAQAAEQEKQANILRGEGEAKRKELVMTADGALEQKLEAYKYVMVEMSKEFGKQKWVPEINMSSSEDNGNHALTMMEMLSVKAAKDLQLDMSMKATKQQ